MPRPCLIAFRDGRDGRLRLEAVLAEPAAYGPLKDLLGRLAGRGLIVQTAVLPLDDTDALEGLVEVLPAFTSTSPPLTLMPVSAFSPDPDRPEVLFASASLFGVGLDLEALAVGQALDGSWQPLPAVAGRYALWQAASGVGDIRPVALPGQAGHFAVFACPLGP